VATSWTVLRYDLLDAHVFWNHDADRLATKGNFCFLLTGPFIEPLQWLQSRLNEHGSQWAIANVQSEFLRIRLQDMLHSVAALGVASDFVTDQLDD